MVQGLQFTLKAHPSVKNIAPVRRIASLFEVDCKMKNKKKFILALLAGIALVPNSVLATQGHGGIEGVYAHQLAHVFFIISMGGLIYWLKQRGLVRENGWKLIRLSAFFFVLWNLDAFFVHALDDQFKIIHVQHVGPWSVSVTDVDHRRVIEGLYYLAKLDHLLCVPAIIFLYLGLKRLLADQHADITRQEHS